MPKCKLCGEEEDKLYVCKKCGTQFCEWCGDIDELKCIDCLDKEEEEGWADDDDDEKWDDTE